MKSIPAMSPTAPPVLTQIHSLIEHYEAFLFDAYGVLVHRDGPLPGAIALLKTLKTLGKPYFVVSNSAARLPSEAAARYQSFGFPLAPHQIVTAGELIQGALIRHGLTGKPCAVLGPSGTHRFVEEAGAHPVPPTQDFEGLVIGDQVGFPFLDFMDAAISRLIQRVDKGLSTPLILPNPDLIYPKPEGFGMTCGSLALVIEATLKQRYPGRKDLRFEVLGKPEIALFAEAQRRAGTPRLLMIGDQIETDILGANRFGIDSALVQSGVTKAETMDLDRGIQPTFLLHSLC